MRVRDSWRVNEARHITIISSSLDVVERRVRLRLRGYDGRGCRRRRRIEGEPREVLKLMNEKNHLNYIGLKKIISIKASLNKGLSKAVQTEFKDIIPEERKIIRATNIPDPN